MPYKKPIWNRALNVNANIIDDIKKKTNNGKYLINGTYQK
jgi:hypothetical protein